MVTHFAGFRLSAEIRLIREATYALMQVLVCVWPKKEGPMVFIQCLSVNRETQEESSAVEEMGVKVGGS